MILAATSSVRFFKDEVPVEVELVVFAVLDFLAVPVSLAFLRAPTVEVFVEADADDFVGREEAVGDALLKRVGVDGLAEVLDVGNLFGFLGRGGQADLRRRGKVFEHLAPGRIVGRAAAMTLVHHHEIKEVGRELLVDVLLFLGAGDRLIKGRGRSQRLCRRCGW